MDNRGAAEGPKSAVKGFKHRPKLPNFWWFGEDRLVVISQPPPIGIISELLQLHMTDTRDTAVVRDEGISKGEWRVGHRQYIGSFGSGV